MKIYVQAKPKSKKRYVKQINAARYTVAVKEPPVDGKANLAIIQSLADYFHIHRSQIRIVHGESARTKIVEMPLSAGELDELVVQKRLL